MWKDHKWNFSDACHNTFNNLKVVFTSAPVLTHWIPDAPMTIERDASDYTIATIFSITLPNGEIHPVTLHSHTFTTSELNYDNYDKELLSILRLFENGDIILKAPCHQSTLSQTTRTLNIFLQPNYQHGTKPGGQNSFPNSVSSFFSALEN